MISYLERKQAIRQHFAVLESISRKQTELLRSAQNGEIDEIIDELSDLIEQRQGLMNQIDLIQKAIGEEIKSPPGDQDPAVLEAISREDAAIRNSMLTIQACDEESSQSAERLLKMIGMELSKARQNLKAVKSYTGGNEYGTPQFFDSYK